LSWSHKEYAKSMSPPEWTRVMTVFSKYEPLAADDITFLDNGERLEGILQAAMMGIVEVVFYGST